MKYLAIHFGAHTFIVGRTGVTVHHTGTPGRYLFGVALAITEAK